MLTELSDRLALIIDAKTDGAVTNIRRLSTEEKAAADRADVLKAKLADIEARAAKQATRPSGVSASTAQQLSRTRSELAGLESSLATVPAGAGTAEKALAKLGLQGTVTGAALTSGLSAAAGGLAVFGAFEFLKSGIDNFTHLADEIRAVQYAASASAEDSSKLIAITTALGVSSDVAALGVFRLGKNIGQTPEKLTNLGIAIARNKQGNVDLIGTLYNVASAYQKTSDGSQRAKIVYEAFGRAGTSMLPILNANAEKLREIASEAGKQGRIFSQADLDSAKEYEITMRELRDSLQALTLTAGRDVVPALSKVAGIITNISDAAHNSAVSQTLSTVLKPYLTVAGLPFRALGGGGGGDAHAKAAAQLQQQQDQAAQAALSQAAAATLGNGFSLLATPGQGLADAKQTLNDAKQTLADAIATRDKAAKALTAARTGTPGADATALEAAAARVTAAQAKLRAAEYVGGDARISGAKATLLSAQESLNKLREKGGTDTNKLAAATERLHKADEAVAAAQRKQKEARKAKERASGLSASDIVADLNAQLKDKTKLAGAQAQLVGLGASSGLVAYLDKQNAAVPGTLVKTVKGLNKALVTQLNSTIDQTDFESGLYSSLTGTPSDWEKAGQDRAGAFNKGFQATFSPAGLPVAAPKPSPHESDTRIPGHRYNFTGPITVNGVDDPKTLARKLAAEARHRALSGGVPTGASL
jgi:hypothetical protein